MNRSVYWLFDSGLKRRSAGVALSLLLVGSAVAAIPGPANTLAPGEQAKQPRTIGKKAVMHVYSYAPKSREITSVTSHFFKDLDACENAVGGALRTALSRVREGDMVDAQCVAIDPPEAQPKETHVPAGITEL